MVKKQLISILLAVGLLVGCASASISSRHDAAEDIARPAGMSERVTKAGLFNLTAWERISQPGAPVNVYIEGDGLAWLNTRTKSLNPTPINPLGLRLAAADRAPNVVYLARPCQYSGWNGHGACPDLYWTSGRSAAEVVFAYKLVLDEIKQRHQASGFNLTGYSGGAGVAALAAAERTDILSLRTVAGNLDYTVFSNTHGVSPMDASLNPAGVAAKLAHIPQLHFISAGDTVIPPAILSSWQLASGAQACLQSVTVDGNSHEKGWAEKWPELLGTPLPACAGAETAPGGDAAATAPEPMQGLTSPDAL